MATIIGLPDKNLTSLDPFFMLNIKLYNSVIIKIGRRSFRLQEGTATAHMMYSCEGRMEKFV